MSAAPSSTNVLVLYATKHGHTAKIAAHVAGTMRQAGVQTEVLEASDASSTDPNRFGGVIVAASIHAGHHQHAMRDWVRTNLSALSERPTAFLSVSLTAAEADEEQEARDDTQRCIDEFLEETGWNPDDAIPVAGALQYREYDVFTRTLMRLIARRKGQSTDTSHDHEYTNWEALDEFARRFAKRVNRS